MRKLLFVGFGAPWHGRAGYQVRQQMFLEALSQICELHLVLFEHSPACGRPNFECEITSIALPPQRDVQGAMPRLLREATAVPLALADRDVRSARRQVAALEPDQFDAVFGYRIDFSYFAGVLGHPRLLLDIDDPEHIRRRERAEIVSHNDVDIWTRLDLARQRRFELRAARSAFASFVCQENDRAAFGAAEPIVVPNCVDVPAVCPPRSASEPVVLFLGNLEGPRDTPNVDGIIWFLREIWPLIRRQCEDATLRIAGPISEWARRDFQQHQGVTALGFVPDLKRELHSASLSISPIRFGTGTRVKIIQCMAEGCPGVSTPKGCEGLDVQQGRDILMGSTPAELADCCVQLLRDQSLQQRIGRAGHMVARRKYDRTSVIDWLANLLGELVERAAAGCNAVPVG